MSVSKDARTDEELLTEYLKTKNRDLFAVLYERMQDRMYAHAMQITKSPDASAEVVQDVFCKLLEVDPQKIRSADSFLFRMVWTRAIDRHREENRGVREDMVSLDAMNEDQEPLEDSEDDDCHFDPIDDLVDRRKDSLVSEVHKSELWEEVKDVLDQLPAGQKEAVEAYYCRGLAINEIAEMLGVPWQTIRTRIRRGMATLRASLAPENAYTTIRRKAAPRRSRAGEYANAV